jgi:hypothetical protein
MKTSTQALLLGCFVVALVACGNNATPSPQKVTPILIDTQGPRPPFIERIQLDFDDRRSRARVEEIFGKNVGPLIRICVALDVMEVLVVQDYDMQADDHRMRSTLRVWEVKNGKHLLPDTPLVGQIDTGPSNLDSRGNSLGDSAYCWFYGLPPGLYEATFNYRQRTGNILSYTWQIQTVEQ